MELIAIKGWSRPAVGKKSTKQIRKEGGIPCVLYGGDEVVHFFTKVSEVRHLIYTPDFKVADIIIDGRHYRCIVKETQYHPVTEDILHMDFIQLVDGNPIKVEVPIRFKGSAAGVKVGGKLLQKLRRAKIKALPEKMITELQVDISHLELGQSIRVKDIQTPEGIEIMSSPGIPVATIEIPRALRSAASAAEKGK